MKRKFENIAIVLFLVVLVSAVIGTILIQQHMSAVYRSNDLNMAKELVSKNGNTMLFVVFTLVFFCLLFLILVFQSIKKINSEKIIQKDKTANDFSSEDLLDGKIQNTGSFKLQEQAKFENLKATIEAIGQEKLLSTNEYCNQILSAIAKEYQIFQGLVYVLEKDSKENGILKISGSYAFNRNTDLTLKLGEGLAGQVAKAKRTVNIKQIPSGYIKAISGLGESTPSNLLICPMVVEDETIAVLELATFKEFSKEEESYFSSLGQIIKEKLLAIQ